MRDGAWDTTRVIDPRTPHQSRQILLISGVCLALLVASALARGKAHGDDVHRPGAPCATCHTTANAAELNQDKSRARTMLRPDLEAVCAKCHGNEGPSHKTNIPSKPKSPAELPLGPGRRITCTTCHWIHGEDNHFGAFLRIDNRRGKLCLSCHTMSELER